MKLKFCLLLLLVALSRSGSAQGYHPFPSANTIWGEAFKKHEDSNVRIIYYGLKSGDTLINTKTYHKLYRSADTVFQEAEFFGGLRDDSAARKVYFFGSVPGNPTGEILLFDFSLNQGDTLKANANGGKNNWYINGNMLTVSLVDSVLLDGTYRKRMYLGFPVPSIWVEGVGNMVRGLLFGPGTYPNNGTWNELVCMQQHNDWFYHLNNSWIYPAHVYPSCTELLLNNAPAQGLREISPQNGGLRFFPNPVTGKSLLVLKDAGNYEAIEVYNAAGSRISSELIGRRTELVFNRTDYTPGLYVYRLRARNGSCVSGRFSVQ